MKLYIHSNGRSNGRSAWKSDIILLASHKILLILSRIVNTKYLQLKIERCIFKRFRRMMFLFIPIRYVTYYI